MRFTRRTPRHVARAFGAEEDDDARYLVLGAEPAERDLVALRLQRILARPAARRRDLVGQAALADPQR